MDHYLIEHCAPTLASIKTANLFRVSFDTQKICLMQYAVGTIHFATKAFYVFTCAFMSTLL